MSSSITRWLLGLKDLPTDTEGLRLTWERPIPDWGWMLVVVLCVLIGIWSYLRMDVTRGLRVLLGGMRVMILTYVL